MIDSGRRRLLALSLLLLAAGARATAPTWLVIEVRGDARRAGKPLAVLDRMAPGDSVNLPAGAFVAAWLSGSDVQYVAAGPGVFGVTASALVLRTGGGSIHAGPAGGRGAAPAADSTMAGAIMRAGGAAEAEPVAPSALRFDWPVRPHRGPWTFRLRDEAGTLLHEAQVEGNAYAPPPEVRLEPGRFYIRELEWDDGQPAPRTDSRRLRTLDAADDRLLTALAAPADASPAQRLAYGLALRRLGMLQEARRAAPELFRP